MPAPEDSRLVSQREAACQARRPGNDLGLPGFGDKEPAD